VPGLVASWFVSAAADGLVHTPAPPSDDEAKREAQRWRRIEMLAAGAPAKAIKALESVPAADLHDEKVLEQVLSKLNAVPWQDAARVFNAAGATTYPEEAIFKTAFGMQRLAAPGPDGITREIWISSLTERSKPLWALLVSRWLSGQVASSERDLLTAVAPAAWPKPESAKLRVIGMTNFLMKLLWRLAGAKARRLRPPPRCQTALAVGGAQSAVAFALRLLENGDAIFIGDIEDAYYKTTRAAALAAVAGSPLEPVANLVYGSPTRIAIGRAVAAEDGLIPGCGGAAELFCRASASPDENVAAHMDDVAMPLSSAAAALRHYAALGYAVVKRRVVVPNAAAMTADVTRVAAELGAEVRIADKYLGSFVGDAARAGHAAREWVRDRAAQVARVTACDALSCQAKFVMAETLLRAAAEKAVTFPPAVVNDAGESGETVAQMLDDLVHDSVVRQLARSAKESSEARRLLFSHRHATGLAFLSLQRDHQFLHDLRVRAAPWPPAVAIDVAARRDRKVVLNERLWQLSADLVSNVEARAWTDDHDWLTIRRVHRKVTIHDDAWRRVLRHRLRIFDPPSCGEASTHAPDDHDYSCVACASHWHIMRHNAVQQSFAQTARDFGISTSFAFQQIYNVGVDGASNERPDLIVFGGEEKPWVLDFSVVHQATVARKDLAARRHCEKKSRYKHFHNDTATIVPFVMTTKVTIQEHTTKFIDVLDRVAGRPGFKRELQNRLKTTLINVLGMIQRGIEKKDLALRAHAAAT
jgi:hypothetical protein